MTAEKPYEYSYDGKLKQHKEELEGSCRKHIADGTYNDPSDAKPGSIEKVAVLAARYEQGAPLWLDGDNSCRVIESDELFSRTREELHIAERRNE